MKTSKFALAALTTLFTSASVAGPTTIQVELDGLVCAFCAQGIEKKMKAQAATDKVFVSIHKRITLVALKDGQDITDATIKAQMTDAGYAVKSIERSDESFDTLRAKIRAAK